MSTNATFNISPNFLRGIKGKPYNAAAVLGEFIDNSYSSFLICRNHPRMDDHLRIDIYCNDDQIQIVDNAGGIKRDLLRNNVLSYALNEYQSNIGLNQYGIGLKEGALWFGKEFTIESKSIQEDDNAVFVSFKLEDAIQQFNENQSVSMPIRTGNRKHFGTTITINQLNRRNSQFTEEKLRSIKVQLSILYKQLISEPNVSIYFNSEQLTINEVAPLKSYLNSNYGSLPNNSYCIKDINAPKIEWKINNLYAETNVIDAITNETITYSISGNLTISETNRAELIANFVHRDTGIRLYRKKKGIHGCTSLYTPFHPNPSLRLYLILHLAGDFTLSDSFTKPQIGDVLQQQDLNILEDLFNSLKNDIESGVYDEQNIYFREFFNHLKQSDFRVEKYRTSQICPQQNGGNNPPIATGPRPDTIPPTPPRPTGKNLVKKIEQKSGAYTVLTLFYENFDRIDFKANGNVLTLELPDRKYNISYDDKFYTLIVSTFYQHYSDDTKDKLKELFS